MPRKTSEVTDTRFPFASNTTAFILVVSEPDADRELTVEGRGYSHASTHDKKYELIRRAQDLQGRGFACTLLAVWPGKKRSDVFEVDDLSNALAMMGSTPTEASS
jgi:hypothetical protein